MEDDAAVTKLFDVVSTGTKLDIFQHLMKELQSQMWFNQSKNME